MCLEEDDDDDDEEEEEDDDDDDDDDDGNDEEEEPPTVRGMLGADDESAWCRDWREDCAFVCASVKDWRDCGGD